MRINALGNTSTDFASDDYIAIDGTTNGSRKMKNDRLLKVTAQNAIAGNLTPAFDPTKPNDAGGYAYYKDDIVAYNGETYKFKVNHLSGAWNGSEVDRYVAGESLKFFLVTDNPEYLLAVTDVNGVILFYVRKDGSFDWQKGVPKNIQAAIDELSVAKVDKEVGKSLIDAVFAEAQKNEDNPEFVKVFTDFYGRLIHAISTDGAHNFFTKVKFKGGVDWSVENLNDLETALKANGFTGGQGDWSDKKTLQIDVPKLAVLNFTNIDSMPTTKTDDKHAVMQFWDLNGNYFKKKVIANAQGNSSLALPKKNISIDLCNDDWIGDDTFKIKFGSWVEQDSFHIKAYYCDYLKIEPLVGYKLFKDMLASRSPFKNRTWKTANIDESEVLLEGRGVNISDKIKDNVDTGALCFPDGFPCIVYLNNVFYGIFCFQLKKHRDNYNMDKDNAKHIHLDGIITTATMWDGIVDWNKFEIRNPKNLYCADGTTYDGDNPAEIVGSADAEAWISAGELPDGTIVTSKITKNLRLTAQVKQYIQDFADSVGKIVSKATLGEKKTEFNKYYDSENLVDYQVFGDIFANVDGFAKNWQWTTWDGVKWFVNPYDVDQLFGFVYTGEFSANPLTSRLRLTSGNYPNKLANDYYVADMIARYAELRKSVFSYSSICEKIGEIFGRVGEDFLALEYQKWNNCPCNRDLVVNEDYWELVTQDGKPVIAHTRENLYSSTTPYSVGDECVGVMGVFDASVDPKWYYTFRCVQNCTGNAPAVYGYRDSIWRIQKWILQQLNNMDVLYNYTEGA